MRGLVAGLLVAFAPTLGGLAQEAMEPTQGTPVTELQVEPTEVQAGMFFDGATVRTSALVPEGYEITISCVGWEEPSVLNRKGKALGLIWMNVGEVEIDGAPVLYLLHVSGDLHEMASASSLEMWGVGYDALKRRARVVSPEGNGGDASLFDEFVGLKESDGLYSVSEAAVEGTVWSG
jgi:hypothetical protein